MVAGVAWALLHGCLWFAAVANSMPSRWKRHLDAYIGLSECVL